jgi:hypothetical protein
MLTVTMLTFYLSSSGQLEADSSFAAPFTVALHFGMQNLLHAQFRKTL